MPREQAGIALTWHSPCRELGQASLPRLTCWKKATNTPSRGPPPCPHHLFNTCMLSQSQPSLPSLPSDVLVVSQLFLIYAALTHMRSTPGPLTVSGKHTCTQALVGRLRGCLLTAVLILGLSLLLHLDSRSESNNKRSKGEGGKHVQL